MHQAARIHIPSFVCPFLNVPALDTDFLENKILLYASLNLWHDLLSEIYMSHFLTV